MATDPQSLLDQSNCFNNFSAQTWLLRLSLLRQIALNGNPSADVSPQGLLNAAQCYNCYGPGTWPLFKLGLLMLILNGGGTPCINVIPNGSTYGSGTPTFTVTPLLTPGKTYQITFGANDVELFNGADSITTNGSFVAAPSGQDIILLGTGNGVPITAIIC